MKHVLASFIINARHESFTPFSKATKGEPIVVDSLTKVRNFSSVSTQQRKFVRLRVCPQVTQHHSWIGELKEVLNGFVIDFYCLSSKRLNNVSALLGGQIVHSCSKILTEIGVTLDDESSSWMKLSPSKIVGSSDFRKWKTLF
ncbi:hypothetical protein VNO78_06536 [Psophocarpus tetragonolobus]|uniref:Uncharacterized protein n=1 Tax=Psophocarpus tetragonolobus TaxID=3891 RepID=A0AAN9T1R0_PSOTE